MQLSRKLQEIVDSNARDRRSLFDSVSGLSASQLGYRPSDGEWSIEDILHHLAISDEANIKLASIMLRQAEEKNLPADPTPDESVLNSLDSLKEGLAQKVKAPDRVAPRSHLPAAESLARLEASRTKLNDAIERLASYDLDQLRWPHPFLGDLNLYQWLMMAGRHESRHTAQIDRIKSAPEFPKA
ncbi:MAG TPA: DinB family protein [Blastocatellia bacterium]|nr:DinB family protein [Blastocatellia bacterium]